MNLKSGHYFSTSGTGAVLWSLIEGGASDAQAAAVLAAAYMTSEFEIAAEIAIFGDALLLHELVEATDSEDVTWSGAAMDLRGVWSAPVLEAFTDMEDLLTLDPIHDVAESGWPTQRPVGDAP